jgi:DNA-binding NtrC family response regulator
MEGVDRHKAHILVVDDEPSARSGLEELLLSAGFRVDVAADGASAMAIAAETPPDVVVTDLEMPKMDGVTLLGKLREQDGDLPVIVVTAFGDVSSAVTAMRAGAADYLTKPVDFDALTLSIERALERRALRAEADELRRQIREREGEGPRIEEEHLPIELAPVAKGAIRIPGATMAEIERFAILSTLEATNGSTTKAAEMLDISVRTIQYRLHEYGIAMKGKRAGD